MRIVDVRWYLVKPGAGRPPTRQATSPARSSSTSTRPRRAADGPGPPSPARAGRLPRRLAAPGIGSSDFVVAYDDAGGTIAARLWWMLDNLGHRGGVAVLDGGIEAWTDAGHPLETGGRRAPRPAELDAGRRVDQRHRARGARRATRSGDPARRSRGRRYRGEVEPIDPSCRPHPDRASARRRRATSARTADFLPPDALGARFAALGATGRRPWSPRAAAATACHNILAMRIAGLPDPILYVGSFSDWSRSGSRPRPAPSRATHRNTRIKPTLQQLITPLPAPAAGGRSAELDRRASRR